MSFSSERDTRFAIRDTTEGVMPPAVPQSLLGTRYDRGGHAARGASDRFLRIAYRVIAYRGFILVIEHVFVYCHRQPG